jgi:hypothetical protein
MQISREEFKKIYYSNTDEDVAKIIGVKSVITVRRYARKAGFKPKGMGFVHKNDKRKIRKVEII